MIRKKSSTAKNANEEKLNLIFLAFFAAVLRAFAVKGFSCLSSHKLWDWRQGKGGYKFNGRPNSFESGRPGSPPPELLTDKNRDFREFCEWHFRASPHPPSCYRPGLRLPETRLQRPGDGSVMLERLQQRASLSTIR
jgi:hypothetical protein